MKKKMVAMLIIMTMSMVLIAGCDLSTKKKNFTKKQQSESISSTEKEKIANPWTESDKQGVLEATGFELKAPDGATDVSYSYMNENKMAQMNYVLSGNQWTYRMQSANELTDISGMEYKWTAEIKGTVADREAIYYGYSDATADMETIDDVFGVHVVNWYDAVTGITYSLSASGKDLNGMDIQVYAEDLYSPL